MIFGKKWALLPVLAVALPSFAQTEASLGYRVEADVNVSAGEYAPMWMTSNRYGLASERPNSGWLRAGVTYDQPLKRNWRVGAGLDLAGALNNGAVSALISFLRTLLFQVAAVLLLPLLLGIDGIWLAVTAAELAALLVSIGLFITRDQQFHYRKAE